MYNFIASMGFASAIFAIINCISLNRFQRGSFKHWIFFFSLGAIWHLMYILLLTKTLPSFTIFFIKLKSTSTLLQPVYIFYAGKEIFQIKPKLMTPLLIFEVVMITLLWTTNYVIESPVEYSFGYFPKAGPLYTIHILSTLIIISEFIRLLIKKFYSEPPGLTKSTMKYAALAFVIYICCSHDFILCYPDLREKLNYPVGPISGIFYSIATSIIMGFSLILVTKVLIEKSEELKRIHKVELEKANIQKEAALTNMKLLQSQLNPHFIFNSLNSIKSAVLTDSQQARTIITKMSSILRWILSKKEQDLMDLKEEVEAVKSYLDIEQIRMGDYLKLNYLIDTNLMDKKVPNFIIQPLVENAVKYGQRTSKDNLNIDVQISQKLNFLNISVSNSGKWVDPKSNPHQYSTGVGLTNLKERMTAIFSSNFTLKTNSQNGIVNVRLSIPLT